MFGALRLELALSLNHMGSVISAFTNWILRNGFWRDEGIWIDTEEWKD